MEDLDLMADVHRCAFCGGYVPDGDGDTCVHYKRGLRDGENCRPPDDRGNDCYHEGYVDGHPAAAGDEEE